MADIIPPGFAEVLMPMKHATLARSALVTYGISHTDVPDTADADALLAVFSTAWQSAIDTEVTYGPVTLRIGQDGGEALVVTGTDTDAGTRSALDSIAAHAAVLIHKRTTRGGRRGRGRMYLPWALADVMVNEAGRLGNDALADLQPRATSWLGLVDGAGSSTGMVVLHSPSGEDVQTPSVPGTPNAVVALTIDPIIGTQRRRLGR